jgi:hypothetical protein
MKGINATAKTENNKNAASCSKKKERRQTRLFQLKI